MRTGRFYANQSAFRFAVFNEIKKKQLGMRRSVLHRRKTPSSDLFIELRRGGGGGPPCGGGWRKGGAVVVVAAGGRVAP